MGKQSTFGDLLTGLLVGGAVGYVYALLNAPRPGDETRQMLNERSKELRDKAIETLHTTADKTEKIVGEGKSRVVSTLETTRDVTLVRADELKDQGTTILHDVRAQASEAIRRVADQVDPNHGQASGAGTTMDDGAI